MVHRSRHLIAIVAILLGFISNAQELVSVNMSSCDKNSNPEYLHTNRLINKELIGDTLNLTIGIVRNCGFYPEINSSYTKDSLNLSSSGPNATFNTKSKLVEIRNVKIEW